MLEVLWDDVFKDEEKDKDIPGWAVLLSMATSVVDFFILKGPVFCILGDVLEESDVPETAPPSAGVAVSGSSSLRARL